MQHLQLLLVLHLWGCTACLKVWPFVGWPIWQHLAVWHFWWIWQCWQLPSGDFHQPGKERQSGSIFGRPLTCWLVSAGGISCGDNAPGL